MAEIAQITFKLFTRPGCDLCEKLLTELESWQSKYRFKIDLVDISENKQLIAEYAGRIPVLATDDEVLSEYFLDENRLITYLENLQNIN